MSDEIKGFIDFESDVPHKKGIQGILFTTIFISIPTALFGVLNIATTLTIIPLLIGMIIWTVYLLINIDNKRKMYYLYLGVSSLYITIVLLIAIYKLLSTIIAVNGIYLIMASIVFVGAICMYFKICTFMINKGIYLKKRATATLSIALPFGIFGIILGRATVGYFSQNSIVIIMCFLLFFLALIYSIGSVNLLKYYYIRMYEKERRTMPSKR